MPLALDTPIPRDSITTVEVVYFNVDLRGNTMLVGFAQMTSSAEVIGTFERQISLRDANDNPRFTAEEYGSIKSAIYRLALEDGIVAGTVE